MAGALSEQQAKDLLTLKSGGNDGGLNGQRLDPDQILLCDMLIKSGAGKEFGLVLKAGETVNISSGLYQDIYDMGIHRLTPVFQHFQTTIEKGPKTDNNILKFKSITASSNGTGASITYTNGLPEGARSDAVTLTEGDSTCDVLEYGLDASATSRAIEVAAGIGVDAVAEATKTVQIQNIRSFEKALSYGNHSQSVPVPTNLTVTPITGTGLTASSTYNVYCFAISAEGLVMANGGKTALNQTSPGVWTFGSGSTFTVAGVSKTSIDGADTWTVPLGGSGICTTVTGTTDTTKKQLVVSCDAMKNAAAYVWLWGIGTGASSHAGAITLANSYIIKNESPTGAIAANNANIAGDTSKNTLICDGVLTHAQLGGQLIVMPKYYNTDGTTNVLAGLTADGLGGINEFNTMFGLFASINISPEWVEYGNGLVNPIKNRVLQNSAQTGASQIMLNMIDNSAGGKGNMIAGTSVTQIRNPYSLDPENPNMCKTKFNPNLPDGVVLFYTATLPSELYQFNETPAIAQIRPRRDWYTEQWPRINRRTTVGTYGSFGVPVYMEAAWGAITNVALI